MRQTFILTKTKPYRHFLKVFLKNNEGKTDVRTLTFTTEHKVSEKERPKRARKVAAEFSTSDENIIDALFRDTGYGKVFVHKDDPEGKKKKEAFNITPVDAKKIALQNLFKTTDLEFDPTKSVEVLNEEYSFYVNARSSVKIGASTATEIKHVPVDVHQTMVDQAAAARQAYEDKYSKPIPVELNEDLGFLSALSDPKFDAEAYIAKHLPSEVEEDDLPSTPAELQKIYFDEFHKNVANLKKNEVAWMRAQILKRRAEK